MNSTTLITGIREDLGYGLQHTEILITDDEADTIKPTFPEPYEEGAPAVFIFFHALSSADNFSAAVFIDADSNENRNILNLTAPTAFEINSVNIDIRILAGKRTGAPLFYMFISFFY